MPTKSLQCSGSTIGLWWRLTNMLRELGQRSNRTAPVPEGGTSTMWAVSLSTISKLSGSDPADTYGSSPPYGPSAGCHVRIGVAGQASL